MENLHLKFTGKMTILIEIEDYGPIEWRVDDFAITKKVCKVLLDATDNTTTVNSYDKRQEKKYRDMLKF